MTEVVTVGRPPVAVAAALVRTARPRQWLKNLLVVAAPAAAGTLTQMPTFGRVAVAFAAFCFVASGVYFLNDARDADADRAHPSKRLRPVAAGILPVGLAASTGATLALAGLALGLAVRPGFGAVILAYFALNAAYTLRLKHEPVLDIACVSGCFVIRAVAGGVAAGVPISHWFLTVVSFGSLFVVAGKRHGEHVELGNGRGAARAALDRYPLEFLRFAWTTAAGVAVTAYCLWAFSRPQDVRAWYGATIVPFVLFVLRYALRVEEGDGGAPEELILSDGTLLALGAAWAALFAVAVSV